MRPSLFDSEVEAEESVRSSKDLFARELEVLSEEDAEREITGALALPRLLFERDTCGPFRDELVELAFVVVTDFAERVLSSGS